MNINRNDLVHSKENIYFAFILLVSILGYLVFLFSIIGIILLGVLIAASLFFHCIMMGGIRRNGVKLGEQQFPELYQKAVIVAKDLGLEKMPDIYVMESEGILNAFATIFVRKNMVVIYSSIFELMDREAEKEVMFVLAHEFTHLKRKHVHMGFLIFPALWVPFLGNAYLRACEYTCDRTAAYYVQSYDAAKNALTMLGIGTTLYKKVNKVAYMEQLEKESGFFVWLNEKLSTHPHLPKRIYAIEAFFNGEDVPVLKEPKGKVWRGLIVFILAFGLLIGAFFGVISLVKKLDLFNNDNFIGAMDDLYYDELVATGSVNEKGEEGLTPLHDAVIMNDVENVQFLLENGADPNILDDSGYSPLIDAIYYYEVDLEIIQLLLDYGADVNIPDSEGATAYDYAVELGNEEILQLLEENSTY